MKEKPLKPLIRIGEASRLLGVHKDTLRNWEKSGELKPHLFSREGTGQRYYLRADIVEFLKTTSPSA